MTSIPSAALRSLLVSLALSGGARAQPSASNGHAGRGIDAAEAGVRRAKSGKPGKRRCLNPMARVLKIMNCIEIGDAACAADGYAEGFVKLHNGVDTNTPTDINTEGFWQGTFALVSLGLDANHAENVGKNTFSYRYAEMVKTTDGTTLGLPPSDAYPFSQSFLQYEHALVTVDNDCRMVKWDQYGDNKEQQDVDDATGAILCALGLCGPPSAASEESEGSEVAAEVSGVFGGW